MQQQQDMQMQMQHQQGMQMQPNVMVVQGGGGICPHPEVSTSFTGCGIATAILLFPVGLLCCLLKQQQRCERCGVLLESGC